MKYVILQILAFFRYNERYEFYLYSGRTPIKIGGEVNECVVFHRCKLPTDGDKNLTGVMDVERSQLCIYTIQFPIHCRQIYWMSTKVWLI